LKKTIPKLGNFNCEKKSRVSKGFGKEIPNIFKKTNIVGLFGPSGSSWRYKVKNFL